MKRFAIRSATLAATLLSFAAPAMAEEVADTAVALCRGNTKEACTFRCSGVLIAPNLVVTARHCARQSEVLEARCDEGTSDTELFDPSTLLATDALVLSPKAPFARGTRWSASKFKASCGHDVVLLELDAPLGASGLTFPSPRFADSAPSGAELTYITFGPGSPGDTKTVGQRKELKTSGLCIGGIDKCSAIAGGNTLQAGEYLTSRTMCQGNSGSPLVLDPSGRKEIVGTLSRGMQAVNGCGYGVTSSFSQHALLFARAAREAAERGKYTLPSWVAVAESRGNSDTFKRGEIGMPCDTPDECSGKDCRSRDSGRTFSCTKSCATNNDCPSGLVCAAAGSANYCFAPTEQDEVESSSCSVSAPGNARVLETSLASLVGVVVAAFVARLRKRAA
ncbi:MAG: trypsin-like serine protease [Polyangiaceae bacterium]